MQAVYDLSRYPANFNVCDFLAMSKARGASHVVLKYSTGDFVPKYKREIAAERLHSIVIPACALFGMTHSFEDGNGIDPGYEWGKVLKAYKELGKIGKAVSVLESKKERYTVTLRDYDRFHKRNSNREAWLRFAESIGAFVIEDWYKKPISLHDRMAYYAGADMNFCVSNGTASLLVYSDYPYTIFMKSDYEDLKKQGLDIGDQLPWANANQRIFWAQDTEENLSALK